MTNTTTLSRNLCSLSEVLCSIRNSKGRYFGLDTFQGETLNARFINETPFYIRVYDRNACKIRSFSKFSILRVRLNKKEHKVISY